MKSFIGALFMVACTVDDKKQDSGEEDSGVTTYNADPTVAITSHSSGAELSELMEHTFVAQVYDANHDNEELMVVWSSNVRALCPESSPIVNGVSECTVVLESDETEVLLQVTDPEGAVATASIEITVVENAAPTIDFILPEDGTEH